MGIFAIVILFYSQCVLSIFGRFSAIPLSFSSVVVLSK